MITEAQEIVCFGCKYRKYYYSPVGAEFDKVTCKADKVSSLLLGCEYYTPVINN